jgi:hypothetical protein
MSFVKWYEDTYKAKWHEEYAGLYAFCYEVSTEYEEFCKRNDLEPIWNG